MYKVNLPVRLDVQFIMRDILSLISKIAVLLDMFHVPVVTFWLRERGPGQYFALFQSRCEHFYSLYEQRHDTIA